MIIRIFRAKIRKSRVSEFKQMVQDQSIPWLESSEGMLGYFPGEPFGENAREFVMITLWRDLDAEGRNNSIRTIGIANNAMLHTRVS